MKTTARLLLLILCLSQCLPGVIHGALGEMANDYEVYMALVSTWSVTGRYEPLPRWTVYFSAGTFFHDLPLEGLHNFDEIKSINEEPEYWGVYEIDGHSGTWKRATYEASAIELDHEGNLLLMGDTYRRLQSVDGMRLHGSWTYYSNPSDAWSEPGEEKPIITFSRDGRFIDHGLFKTEYLPLPEHYDEDEWQVDEADIAPGQGRYEIADFTLILNFDDGRTRTAAYSLFYGDPTEESPAFIYIYRGRLSLIE